MDLNVGDKVRIKSKEWFKNNGFFSSESSISDCYGKEATITERMEYGYSINIGPKCIFWQETAFEPMSNWSVNMPKDTELKKTVTVNMPNDLDVSTVEYDGKITINILHKEDKKEEPKFKNGDVIYVEESDGGYISIFQNMWDDVIDMHAVLHLRTGLVYTKEILIRKNIISIRKASRGEQSKLFQVLAKQKKLHWNAEGFKFEEYRWRAKNGERYWHITELGTVLSSPDYHSPYDNILCELRNYFQTEELAKQALPKYKDFLKNLNIK